MKTQTLKQKLNDIIKEEQELKLKLEQLQEVKEVIAGELLDSVHSDTYSLDRYTIYRKPFYKFNILNEKLVKKYQIEKIVLDQKAMIKEYLKNGAVRGVEITKDVKVIVRLKTGEEHEQI